MKKFLKLLTTAILTLQKQEVACEISSGTLIGAVKLLGILPWEIDADIVVYRPNMTDFKEQVVPDVSKKGYRFVSSGACFLCWDHSCAPFDGFRRRKVNPIIILYQVMIGVHL